MIVISPDVTILETHEEAVAASIRARDDFNWRARAWGFDSGPHEEQWWPLAFEAPC